MKGVVKVPVVMQMEALECGAASLAMILAYHGKWVPLEQVRSDCGVSRDGSKATNILKAARAYGLEASGLRCEVEDLRAVDLPAIIFWNFNHFVVFNGFNKKGAVINDPARGTVVVPMSEFDAAFTGVCLRFKVTDAFQKGGKPKSMIDFAKTRLKGTFAPFVFVMVTGILTALIGIITPAFSRIFLDRLLTGASPDWLLPFILAMSAMALIQFVITVINAIYMLKIEGKLAIVANSTYIWHVLRLPMNFFSQRMAGDIAARQSENEGIASTLISELAPVALNFAMLVLYLVVMLRYNLVLTAIGVCSVFLNIYIARVVSKKRVNLTRVQMRDAGKLSGATMSGIEMIETIKASGAENGFFERWAGYQASVNASTVRFAALNQYLGSVPGMVQQVAGIAILMVGTLFIMRGDFTVGMLTAFQGFMSAFLQPVNALLGVGQSIQEMRTSMERIEDVMSYPPDVPDDATNADEEAEFDKLSGAVEMRDVTFGYSKLAPPLIENFNLSLKPGQRVAFVGSSGCGKSTLAKLISGLYRPWSGEILFDGQTQDDIHRATFTGSLAVVDQDIILFEDTIAQNIKLWDKSIEDFEMILAARDAQIHSDVMLRDGGYSHMITEGGRNFSGGQRQRFEIARVLAQDPTIVILDEATSALDAKTEFDVVNAIKERGITLIIVAHRLSTIRDCDEIVVMDKGKVVERGTHKELYAKGGLYTQLVTTE